MLTPKELYYQYTTEPCEYDIGGQTGDAGRGTPYELQKLSNFLKQLKYPCYNSAPKSQKEAPEGILNTGSGKLGIPFKFLERLDVEAFSETQPDIKSGTSHAIRNACDVMRACYLENSGQRLKWDHRTATEYLKFFGGNKITDCLMMLGPDLVSEETALSRGTGCGLLGCLPKFNPKKGGSALGAGFSCQQVTDSTGMTRRECTPCGECNKEPEEIQPGDEDCCTAKSCEETMNWCCGDVSGERSSWYYKSSIDEKTDYPLKHLGILLRKSYGGYVNLLNNSGSNFYSCPPDIMLKYFQTLNQYDYKNHSVKTITDPNIVPVDRVRTISMIQSNNDPNAMTQSIKDLLYNGYGVVLMTNVGFSNKRDSSGISYPDRIWYHSYAIIGYDDRKTDYSECVYLLANSWGKWNDGGHPDWGPIPEGSFLVTETHLKCMIKLFRSDQFLCRGRVSLMPELSNISCLSEDDSCSPWSCATKQRSLGMLFALSMNDGFPIQKLDYSQFYKQREYGGRDLLEPIPSSISLSSDTGSDSSDGVSSLGNVDLPDNR